MSLINNTEKYLLNVVKDLGFEIDSVPLVKSQLPQFGEYQINVAMSLAKQAGKNPREIAQTIVDALDDRFINVNIQGPGFINVSFSDKVLLDYLNESIDNFENFIDKDAEMNTIVLDYGGANIAKELHVGHLRCNIGEAIRRLLNLYGVKTISDVHWGDWGTPMGQVILGIKNEQPDLPYFDPNFEGEYPSESPVTNDDLGRIYPMSSKRCKEDEEYANEARKITEELQKGNPGYRALWKHILKVSKEYCNAVYEELNCKFDYSYGESDAYEYVYDVIDFLNEKGVTEKSDGALIMHVKTDEDNKEVPPLMLVKSDGGVGYDTAELGTIYQREKDFHPTGIYYFTDNRQELHFEQTFRGALKSGMVPESMDFKFLGFGTINGKDGKPFKTRDGGVMPLVKLIEEVKNKIEPNIKEDITGDERVDVRNKLAIAALKYADLLPSRTTDYIFDIDKFTSFDGKTGIYIVYTATRIKSLLKRLNASDDLKITVIPNQTVRDVLVKLTEISKVFNSSRRELTTSYICEYVYELASLYNKFYTENNISNESDEEVKNSYIALSKLVYNTISNILNVLAIDEVERM